MASDEEVGRQILSIFMQHKVGASGVLRRNHFIDVRDADFQRGLNKALENRWIKVKLRDRYTYELTEAGLAAGLNARLPSKPLGLTPARRSFGRRAKGRYGVPVVPNQLEVGRRLRSRRHVKGDCREAQRRDWLWSCPR